MDLVTTYRKPCLIALLLAFNFGTAGATSL